LNLDAPEVLVEIPFDIQATKKADMALARDWRMTTRAIFEAYFARGYTAVDLARQGDGETRRNLYVLAHVHARPFGDAPRIAGGEVF